MEENYGTQPGTEEVHTPAASSQRRLEFTGSASSSPLFFVREDGQPYPTAPVDTHRKGSALSQVPLSVFNAVVVRVLAAAIAVIFPQHGTGPKTKSRLQKPVSSELKGKRGPALRCCVFLLLRRTLTERLKG